jgi:hypothetical protein
MPYVKQLNTQACRQLTSFYRRETRGLDRHSQWQRQRLQRGR